jgi:hypothetical protein
MKKTKFRSFGMLGKHHSQETKDKISAAKLGRKMTEEKKRKISIGHKKLAHNKNKKRRGDEE